MLMVGHKIQRSQVLAKRDFSKGILILTSGLHSLRTEADKLGIFHF